MFDSRSSAAVSLHVLLSLALVFCTGALAAPPSPTDAARNKPMNMDEPMPTKMAKPGMKKGDVKAAAKKKDRKMREMLEKEQRSSGAGKK